MNRRRLLIVLLLALMSGGLAGYSALQYLRQRPAPVFAAEPARRGIEIMMAARDLPLGHYLTSEDVIPVPYPAEALPAGYTTSADQVVGRGLLTSVRMYEPLLDIKLGEKGVGGGLPIVIPEGMRAVTVRVDEVIGVAGFVRPQTRVDVILIITPPNDNQPISRTILQNVTSLAGGQDYVYDETGKPVVVPTMTLLVTLEDAEKLTLAAQQGKIQLALRNMLDLDTVRTQGARVPSLLQGATAPRATGGGSAPAPQQLQPTQVAPRRSEVEVFRGGNRSLIQYGNP